MFEGLPSVNGVHLQRVENDDEEDEDTEAEEERDSVRGVYSDASLRDKRNLGNTVTQQSSSPAAAAATAKQLQRTVVQSPPDSDESEPSDEDAETNMAASHSAAAAVKVNGGRPSPSVNGVKVAERSSEPQGGRRSSKTDGAWPGDGDIQRLIEEGKLLLAQDADKRRQARLMQSRAEADAKPPPPPSSKGRKKAHGSVSTSTDSRAPATKELPAKRRELPGKKLAEFREEERQVSDVADDERLHSSSSRGRRSSKQAEGEGHRASSQGQSHQKGQRAENSEPHTLDFDSDDRVEAEQHRETGRYRNGPRLNGDFSMPTKRLQRRTDEEVEADWRRHRDGLRDEDDDRDVRDRLSRSLNDRRSFEDRQRSSDDDLRRRQSYDRERDGSWSSERPSLNRRRTMYADYSDDYAEPVTYARDNRLNRSLPYSRRPTLREIIAEDRRDLGLAYSPRRDVTDSEDDLYRRQRLHSRERGRTPRRNGYLHDDVDYVLRGERDYLRERPRARHSTPKQRLRYEDNDDVSSESWTESTTDSSSDSEESVRHSRRTSAAPGWNNVAPQFIYPASLMSSPQSGAVPAYMPVNLSPMAAPLANQNPALGQLYFQATPPQASVAMPAVPGGGVMAGIPVMLASPAVQQHQPSPQVK